MYVWYPISFGMNEKDGFFIVLFVFLMIRLVLFVLIFSPVLVFAQVWDSSSGGILTVSTWSLIQTGQTVSVQTGQADSPGQQSTNRYDQMIIQLESQKQTIDRLLEEEDRRLQERKAWLTAVAGVDPQLFNQCRLPGWSVVVWDQSYDELRSLLDTEYRRHLAAIYVAKIQNDGKPVTNAIRVADAVLLNQIVTFGDMYQDLILQTASLHAQSIDYNLSWLQSFLLQDWRAALVSGVVHLDRIVRDLSVASWASQTFGLAWDRFIAMEKRLADAVFAIVRREAKKRIDRVLLRSPYLTAEREAASILETVNFHYQLAYLAFVDQTFGWLLSRWWLESWFNASRGLLLKYGGSDMINCEWLATVSVSDATLVTSLIDEWRHYLSRLTWWSSSGMLSSNDLRKVYKDFFFTQYRQLIGQAERDARSLLVRLYNQSQPDFDRMASLEELNTLLWSTDNVARQQALLVDIVSLATNLVETTNVRTIRDRARRILEASQTMQAWSQVPAQDSVPVNQSVPSQPTSSSSVSVPSLASLPQAEQDTIRQTVATQLETLAQRFPDMNQRRVAARTVRSNTQIRLADTSLSDTQRVLLTELIRVLDELIGE